MQALMAMVESSTFDAAVGVASDLRTMLKASAGQVSRELARAASLPRNRLWLAKRILTLCERDFDVRYQNPLDTAVTVYLWILSMTDPLLAGAVATSVLGLRNGWWAPRFAREVLSERAARGEAATTETLLGFTNAAAIRIDSRIEPREDPEIAAHGFARHLQHSDRTVRVRGRSLGLPNAEAVTIGKTFAAQADTPTDDLAEVA